MKKYSFRLQTVLEMREKKLEDKRREMAIVVTKLNEQLQALNNLTSEQEKIKTNLEFIYDEGKELDITEITNYKDYLGKVIVVTKNQEKKFYQHYEYVQAKEIDDIASTRFNKMKRCIEE